MVRRGIYVPLEVVGIFYSFSYEEVLWEIFDWQVHLLKMKEMAFLKVL